MLRDRNPPGRVKNRRPEKTWKEAQVIKLELAIILESDTYIYGNKKKGLI